MKKILICIVMLCIVGVVFAEKATELKELLNPKKIFVQGDRLLTVEPTTISIYSLKDYKLIKKFGKAGEGPQEFKINPTSGFPTVKVCLTSDAIFVTSIGRLSIFTPDGEFVKMENIGPDLQEVHPFADKFIGWTTGLKKKFDYWILNLYSSDSNKLKELYAVKNTYQATEGLKVLSRSLRFQVYKDKF
ncbi:MAG: hypothetical protein GY765_12815, partial [bacterium]|nr:hypothetical protein [bacterium]